MGLDEALRIANILELDDVISPVALACRTLADEVHKLEDLLREIQEKDE